MTKNDIIDIVNDALAAYRKNCGHYDGPKFICITSEIEKALSLLDQDDRYMLGIKLKTENDSILFSGTLRENLVSFMGLDVKWDADQLEFLDGKEIGILSDNLNV